MRKCPEFLSPHVGDTGGDGLRTMTTWPGEYISCASIHNSLVDALNNSKEAK